jgi:hypothetical protein
VTAGPHSIPEKLARGTRRLDRVTDGDRLFFARHRHRNHRLRQAERIEIEQEEIIAGRRWEPRGLAWFTIVRQLAPGLRVRAIAALPQATDPDISESRCESIFDRHFAESRRGAGDGA